MKTMLAAFLFFTTVFIFSQEVFEVNPKGDKIEALSTDLALLWNNTMLDSTGSGIISTEYGARNPDSTLINAADDFFIMNDHIWTIDSVFATGFVSAGVPIPPLFGLVIYGDNGGSPGSIIYSDTLTNTYGLTANDVGLNPSGVWALPSGRYWVSVFGIYTTATTTSQGRWNWIMGYNSIDSISHLQDKTGIFGGFPWTKLTSLGLNRRSNYFAIYGTDAVIPVELTSFTASATANEIRLLWQTATEKNNKGFEVQRKSSSEFETIGFVEGKGTTTEVNNYQYVDTRINSEKYIYRLKQIDYDGSFEYSNEIEVDVNIPDRFSLEQNYPNPFNPETKINFGLTVESNVSLKIFNTLGEEVTTLLNSNLPAGMHSLDFNAAGLTSGVYIYQINAAGVDGTVFTSTKKMILNK